MKRAPQHFITKVLIVASLLPSVAQASHWTKLQDVVERVQARPLDDIDAELEPLTRRGNRWTKAAASFVRARYLAGQGRFTEARESLQKARIIRRVSSPAYRYAGIEILLAEGQTAAALEELRELRRRFPRFRWAAVGLQYSRLQEKHSPPTETAATALELAEKSPLHLPADELLDRAARMLEPSDRPRAMTLYQRIVLEFPESPLAVAALEKVGADTLSLEMRFARLERLFERRAYELCRAEGALLWTAGHRPESVGYYLGKIGSERLRDDYEGAERYLLAAIAPDAPFAQRALSSYGIVLSKLGRHDDAVAAFDKWLERYPNAPNRRVVEAHYDRGRALHRAGRFLQAANDLAAYLSEHREGFDWPKYWWFVGFWTFQAGDYEKALELFAPLVSKSNSLVGGKARYWRARAQHQLERQEEAVSTLARLIRSMPLTYYAGLAENQLRAWGHPQRIPRRRALPPPAERSDPFLGLPTSTPLKLLRVAVHLGEPDTARRVLESVRRRLQQSLGAEAFTKLEHQLALPLERFHEERLRVRRASRRALRRYPTADTVAAWRGVYPQAFSIHVEAAAERFGIPSALIYAHMLAESRFNPDAVSPAGAYGAMQLLDRTASRLAADQSEPYQRWMIMQPRHNIRWGAQYLGALVQKFHDQLPFAIGSYNGGPMLLEVHLGLTEGLPFDQMVDDMGPHESRNYTRKVIEYCLRYLALYATTEEAQAIRARLLPMEWTQDYLEHPDY